MCRLKLIKVTYTHKWGQDSHLFLCEKELSPTEEDVLQHCTDMDYDPDLDLIIVGALSNFTRRGDIQILGGSDFNGDT